MDACVRVLTDYKGNWPSFSRRVGNIILGFLLSKTENGSRFPSYPCPPPRSMHSTSAAHTAESTILRSIACEGACFLPRFSSVFKFGLWMNELPISTSSSCPTVAHVGVSASHCEDYPQMTCPISTPTHESYSFLCARRKCQVLVQILGHCAEGWHVALLPHYTTPFSGAGG